MLNSRTKQWSARKVVSLTHAVLLISCRKTHQSQGQVTFLKTVPLFLQGYTYYLKRVMTPMLEPASKVPLYSLLALSHSPESLTVDTRGAVQGQNREVCHHDVATVPNTVSETTAKPSEHTHLSKRDFPQITRPPPPGT